MSIVLIVFFIVVFFVGVFCGQQIYRKIEKEKSRRVFSRLERRNIMKTINALVSAIDFKDHRTKRHSDNVKMYACAIAEAMGLSSDEIKIIREACQLHDLGKIGVHDYILTKPGKLTEEEWKEIRLHSLAGAIILKPLNFLDKVVQVIRQHHERFDGGGYPDGIKREAICLGARIMAVADSFDAMTSKRPYRDPMSIPEAIEELKRNSGKQFDPRVVETFLGLLQTKPEILKLLKDNAREPGFER